MNALGVLDDLSEIKDLISRYSVAIICGSYISTISPTNIPNGNVLTGEMFDLLFRKNPLILDVLSSDDLDMVWLQYKGKSGNDGVPFEMLFESCPYIDKIKAFLNVFFNGKPFNDIHRLFIQLICNGKIQGVVTPNYDNCLINAASGVVSLNNVYNASQITDIDGKACCLYLHGCVEDNNANGLVVTLSDEKLMPEWKSKALRWILNNKVVFLVGYSGRDYEICPEIYSMLISNEIKGIIWNTFEAKVNENMRMLLESASDGISSFHIIGDMQQLLNRLFDAGLIDHDNPLNNHTAEFEIGMRAIIEANKILSLLWIGNILINMGCVIHAMKLFQYYKDLLLREGAYKPTYYSHLAACLYKMGFYREAGHCYSNQIRSMRGLIDRYYDRVVINIDRFDNYRTGKMYVKAVAVLVGVCINLFVARRTLKRNVIQEHEAIARLLYRLLVLLRNLTSWNRNVLKRLKRVLYINGVRFSVESGNRVLQQNFELENDILGLNPDNILALPNNLVGKKPSNGYRELGNFFEFAISQRRKLTEEYINASMDLERRKVYDQLEVLSDECAARGLFPEAYKCLLPLVCKSSLYKSKIVNLYKMCQYSWYAKLADGIRYHLVYR